MSRIRHATETFVNHLIDGVKKLIASNTEQIEVLSDKFSIKGKANWQNNNWKTEADPPSMYGTLCETIFYSSPNQENGSTWNGEIYCIVRTLREIGNVARQEVFGVYGIGGTFVRYDKGNDTWSEWQSLATTQKKDILFPYNSGFKDESATWKSFIEQGSAYTRIILNLTGSDGTLPRGVLQIATLPLGSRPVKNLGIIFGTSDAQKFCKGVIYTSGVIAINNPYDNITYLEGHAIF